MQIVKGAYAVILQKGLAGTATRDVTRELGVGSGLLHHYYDTWADLRAEVVKTFISKEIAEMQETLSDAPPDMVFDRFIDWMISDPEFRFWKLWLDAIEESRRDPLLADIVQKGHVLWHAAIMEMIDRATASDPGQHENPKNAAWRISALTDGLMGMLIVGRTPLTLDLVKELLNEQITLELGRR